MVARKPDSPTLGDIVAVRETHLVSTSDATNLLGMSSERIRQLVQMGYIPEGPRKGLYSLIGVVQGYIGFLKDEEKSRSKVAAESGVKRAREIEIMQRVGERARKLIETAEAAEHLDDIVAIVLNELDGLPSSYTRDLKQRRLLQVKIDGVRSRIHAGLDAKILSLRTGASEVPAEEDLDA